MKSMKVNSIEKMSLSKQKLTRKNRKTDPFILQATCTLLIVKSFKIKKDIE